MKNAKKRKKSGILGKIVPENGPKNEKYQKVKKIEKNRFFLKLGYG